MLIPDQVTERKLEWLQWAIKAYSKPQRSGCWAWLRSKNKNGYGTLRLNRKTEFVHRVSYLIFKGPIAPGLCVCHSCDNPWCVNPAHLWLGTRRQNFAGMMRKGRVSHKKPARPFLPGHTRSQGKRKRKLTDAQVREIRATLYNREPLRVVADRFGISMAQVSMIRRGKRKQLIT